MTPELAAQSTIDEHAIYAMGAAALPIPLLDIAAVTAIQLDMVADLAGIYGVEHDVTSNRTLVTSLVGASLPRVCASMVKLLPGAGWLVGALTQVVLSGATTWAVGQLFARLFASGRPLRTVEIEDLRAQYTELVDEGSRVVGRLERDHSRRDARSERRPRLRGVARALVRLERLRDKGAISDGEFQRLKTVALSSLEHAVG